MFKRPACVDCHRVAPQTNTAHTLLSKSFGWRLSRSKGPGSAAGVEWRCPPCWRLRKAATAKPETNS